MKIVRLLTMTALLLPLAACGASEEEEAEAQAEAEALAESLGNAMDEAAEEATAEAEEAAEEAEAEAPAAAAEGDGSTCEQAYDGILQMVAAMKKQMGGGDGEIEEDEEKRAEFMEKCGELPPEVQQCLVMSYAVEHQEECEQYRDQLQAVRPAGG
jgi:chromosome segregation ATPase